MPQSSAKRCKPSVHSTAGKARGRYTNPQARCCQRVGAHSNQATHHSTAADALARPSHTVVPSVPLLRATWSQASRLQACGHRSGKGHRLATLAQASAANTAK